MSWQNNLIDFLWKLSNCTQILNLMFWAASAESHLTVMELGVLWSSWRFLTLSGKVVKVVVTFSLSVRRPAYTHKAEMVTS